MSSIEESIEETAKRYGNRVARLAPDPDDMARCPVCGEDFIVAEIFPHARTRDDIADTVKQSIKLQMQNIVETAREESSQIVSDLSESIKELERNNSEIIEERDIATEKLIDVAPRVTCIREIMATVKKVRMNVAAIMQSFRPTEINDDEKMAILQRIATIQGDTIDHIFDLIVDAFDE